MGEEREPSMRNRTLLRPCALFVRILRTLSGREYRHCRRTAVSWKSGRVLCRHHGTFPRMEHTYLTYMRQSVLGSLMQYGVPFFLCRRHDDSILISCCKNSCLPRNSRKAALPGWLSGKKSSSLRSGIFFRQALQGCGQTDNRDNKK